MALKQYCMMCKSEMVQMPSGLFICRHCDLGYCNSYSQTDPCRNTLKYFGSGIERWSR